MQIAIALYLVGVLYFFFIFYNLFKENTNLDAEQKRISWIALMISSGFWPLVVPISCIEKRSIKHLLFNGHSFKKSELTTSQVVYKKLV